MGKTVAKLMNPGGVAAQAAQQKALKKQAADQAAAEAGLARVRGGGGFLAYVENALKDKLG